MAQISEEKLRITFRVSAGLSHEEKNWRWQWQGGRGQGTGARARPRARSRIASHDLTMVTVSSKQEAPKRKEVKSPTMLLPTCHSLQKTQTVRRRRKEEEHTREQDHNTLNAQLASRIPYYEQPRARVHDHMCTTTQSLRYCHILTVRCDSQRGDSLVVEARLALLGCPIAIFGLQSDVCEAWRGGRAGGEVDILGSDEGELPDA